MQLWPLSISLTISLVRSSSSIFHSEVVLILSLRSFFSFLHSAACFLFCFSLLALWLAITHSGFSQAGCIALNLGVNLSLQYLHFRVFFMGGQKYKKAPKYIEAFSCLKLRLKSAIRLSKVAFNKFVGRLVFFAFEGKPFGKFCYGCF